MEWNKVLEGVDAINRCVEISSSDLIGCMDDNHPVYIYAYPVLYASMIMQYFVDNANDDKGRELAEWSMQVARRVMIDFDERYKEYKRKATE